MEQERETDDEMARERLRPQGVPGKSDAHEKKPETSERDLPKTGGSFDDGHVK